METDKKNMKKFFRSNKKVIAGVCGGVAEYFNIDPLIVRIIWAIATFVYGIGLGAYIIIWIIAPEK